MCTVTFIPIKNGFVLTSNRDEMTSRATLPVRSYKVDGKTIVYPKDTLKGGTWIACDLNGRAACLLNGAFKNHNKLEYYSRSRGAILLESFNFEIDTFPETVNLEGIEPFTLLLLAHGIPSQLIELRWDGLRKYTRNLDTSQAYIWSSATLYNALDSKIREEWFTNWIRCYSNIEDNNILNFHSGVHTQDNTTNILMNRKNGLQTVSISQVKTGCDSKFRYIDLINDKITEIELNKNLCTMDLQ
jgi:hypothetical protein